jgi:pimeloyl-ACP methyl ester carboxylesterase
MSAGLSGLSAATEDEARAVIARVDALSTHHDIEQAGVRVRWRRFGPADGGAHPPLVLLHGGHGSWMHWLRNAEALSAERALWLPDMPGFNDSGTPPPPAPDEHPLAPSLAALAGSLDALIGAGTPIDLGGFSFGGVVASQFALHRRAVRRMLLVGSGGHGTMRRMAVEMINWRLAQDREAERAALLHNLGALMLHDMSRADPLAFEIHDIACHGTRFRSKEVSRRGGLQVALAEIPGPKLFLWGEFDVTADSRALVARLVAEGPQREGAVVDGAWHWVQYERAEEFNRRVADFLDR